MRWRPEQRGHLKAGLHTSAPRGLHIAKSRTPRVFPLREQ